MLKFKFTVAVIAALACANSASAGNFLADRAQWLELSPSERNAYAMGYFDSMLVHKNGDTANEVWVLALNQCARQKQLTSAMLSDWVRIEYDTDASTWKLPVSAVVHNVVVKNCRYYLPAKAYDDPPPKK